MNSLARTTDFWNSGDSIWVRFGRAPGGRVVGSFGITEQCALVAKPGHSVGFVVNMPLFKRDAEDTTHNGNRKLKIEWSPRLVRDVPRIDTHLDQSNVLFDYVLILVPKDHVQFGFLLLEVLRVSVVSVNCVGNKSRNQHCHRMSLEQIPILA